MYIWPSESAVLGLVPQWTANSVCPPAAPQMARILDRLRRETIEGLQRGEATGEASDVMRQLSLNTVRHSSVGDWPGRDSTPHPKLSCPFARSRLRNCTYDVSAWQLSRPRRTASQACCGTRSLSPVPNEGSPAATLIYRRA